MLIAVSPVGASSINNLLNSLAGRWGITVQHPLHLGSLVLGPDDIVGLFNGLGGNLICSAGCMVGGLLADRMNRRLAYALAGALTALTGVAMALCPLEPWAYLSFGLAINFFVGITFAALTAFVLETIGKGAVATKYNIFASLANVAIGYMTKADGEALRRFGVRGMLLTDSALVGCGILLLVLLLLVARRPAAARA
jgi:MFS family permease